MQAYQQFAVYALRDKQPVFTDGSETEILRTVDRNTRLNVIRREGAHYMVRILNQVAFVPVDDVSSDRGSVPVAKFGDWATAGSRDTATNARVVAPAGEGGGPVALAQLGFKQAPFLTRFLSFLIDGFTIGVVNNILAGLLIVALGLEPLRETTGADGMQTLEINWSDYWTITMFTVPLAFAYYVAGTATMGTLGMILMKIHVIDNETGRAPDFAGSVIRVLVSWVGAIPLYLGYFWALWNDGRTWHDMAANTTMVQYR